MSKQKLVAGSRGITLLLVALTLIVAVIAGNAVLRDSGGYALKPATGTAQAMAAAAAPPQDASRR